LNQARPVTLAERYLLLGLRLGRLQDGLVDGYYGPESLRALAESGEPADPNELRAEAGALKSEIEASDLDPGRRTWLASQVSALECVAELLSGVELAWPTKVHRCYGIEVGVTPEEQFERAHAELDAALPGSGDLADRLERWKKAREIPSEKLLDAFTVVSRELREATRNLVDLPAGEELEVVLVSSQPWSAYNWYLGGRRSRIDINTDLPTHSHQLGHVVAHEGYPGHHTEHACKEARLVDELGRPEASILLIHTPECVVSEGIAQIALEQALGQDWPARVAEILQPLGLAFDPEVAAVVDAADNVLDDVAVNVSYFEGERGWKTEELVEYLRRYALANQERAEKRVAFSTHPFWGAYTPTYPVGRRLAHAFAACAPGNFRRLLTEELTPADLAAACTSSL
jgi:hypothetical protein